MATGRYIDLTFELNGETFQQVNIEGTDYFFRIKYNTTYNFFMVLVYDADRNFIYAGRLIYGQSFPPYQVSGINFTVTPFNLIDSSDQDITTANAGNALKLYLDYTL